MDTTKKKTGLRSAGEICTLIGCILETIFHSAAILATFFMWLIPGIIFIVLSWVTRNQAVKNDSKGWMIYGIIQSFFFNWVGLAGYICLLIEKIQREKGC